MRIYLNQRGNFLDNKQCVKQSLISCLLHACFKVTVLLWAQKTSSEYSNNGFFLMSKIRPLQQGLTRGLHKLVNQFLLFKYSYPCIFDKQKIFLTLNSTLECALLAAYCMQVSMSNLFHVTRNFAEYSNKRILLVGMMALLNFRILINRFLLFKYLCAYISVRERISQTINSGLETAH